MAFRYQKTKTQGSVDGKQTTFHVAAAHTGVIGPGDLVRITGTSDTDGVQEVDTGVANTANTGTVSSVVPKFEGEQLSTTHLPATTAGYVLVNIDGGALFEVPVSNGPLTVANVGLNAPAVVTAGTVSDGVFMSNMGINATGVATTATLPFRIEELREDENGVLGNRALVSPNATTDKAGVAGR